jgi:hypothetical protein
MSRAGQATAIWSSPSKLEAAAQLVISDSSRRHAALWTALAGALELWAGKGALAGAAKTFATFTAGAVLLFVATYVFTTRKPVALLVAGLTAVALAVSALVTLYSAWPSASRLLAYQNSYMVIIEALALAQTAWACFKSFRLQRLLIEETDEQVNRAVVELMESMRRRSHRDDATVEWKEHGIAAKGVWRIAARGPLLFLVKFSETPFRLGHPEQAVWLNRADMRVVAGRQKWLGRRVLATIGTPRKEFRIETTPVMLKRLEDLLSRRNP